MDAWDFSKRGEDVRFCFLRDPLAFEDQLFYFGDGSSNHFPEVVARSFHRSHLYADHNRAHEHLVVGHHPHKPVPPQPPTRGPHGRAHEHLAVGHHLHVADEREAGAEKVEGKSREAIRHSSRYENY